MNSSNCQDINYQRIEELVAQWCEIILTQSDSIDKEKATAYIDELQSEDIKCLNSTNKDDPILRDMVLEKISNYIESFDDNLTTPISLARPFEFDSGNEYSNFLPYCESYYKEKFQGNSFPNVLDFTIRYIGEISEHHSVFVRFYDIHSKQVANNILTEMKKSASCEAKKAVEEATREQAQKEEKNAVDEKMVQVKKDLDDIRSDLTRKTAETSVTMLGIFAAIVITIVAGLLYSSSVIESINTADFYRLVCITAIVGLICFDLITTLFYFIERISGKKESYKAFNSVFWFINIVLVVIAAVVFVCRWIL